jgi:hypothetical protein
VPVHESFTPHQDRTICLAHLRNRHITATETALTMVGNHNRHIHPKTEKPIARVWSASSSTLHRFSSHSCTSHASYGLVGGTWSDIPPQTITEPPPNISLSRTQASAKRSPRRRYTRRRPSGRKRVNRDSSVKKTRLHCLIGNCLGPCTTNQAIRRVRCARVRGKPM